MSLLAFVAAIICFLLVLVPGVTWPALNLIAAGLLFAVLGHILSGPLPWSRSG